MSEKTKVSGTEYATENKGVRNQIRHMENKGVICCRKQRCQEPNTPHGKQRCHLLETVPDTNGTVVIVSYFTCSVYAIQLGARRVASASAGNRDGGA